MFEHITAHVWDAFVRESGKGSALLASSWEQVLQNVLPFISFEHYRYREDCAIRIAQVKERYTSAPFSEGGDVISISDEPLDVAQLAADFAEQFGTTARMQLNERFCAAADTTTLSIKAHEHVVALTEPLIPRVRKTLRHILEKEPDGWVERTTAPRDIDRAYQLYLSHVRRVKNFALPHTAFMQLITDIGAELWVYREHDQVEAMAVFMPVRMSRADEPTGAEVLYALSASSAAGFRVHAPHHLVYKAFVHYQQNGIARASLGTTGSDSSLETFKRGWRGSAYAVYEIGSGAHERVRTSPLRSLVRLVPLPLYPSLTTALGKRFL